MKFSDATLLTFALGAAAQLRATPADNNNINAGPFAKRDITDVADAIDADGVTDAFNQVSAGFAHSPNSGFGGPGFVPGPHGGLGGPGFGPRAFKRDLVTVSGVITSLNKNLKSVATALTGLMPASAYSDSANSAQENGFEYTVNHLVIAAYEGVFRIQSAPQLSTDEVKQVQDQLNTLQKTGNDLVTALTTAQPNIQAVNMCEEVTQRMDDMVTNMRPLLDAIATKAPGMVSAAQTTVNFVSALEQKRTLFAAGGCIDRDNLDLDNVNPF